MARPLKLTDEFQKAFCEQLATGATFETAAEALGVAPDTVGKWIARGRKATTGRFVEFRLAVVGARAKVVQRLLARAQQRVKSKKDGGEGADPLPLLAVLDRRYSQQVRVQVTTELTALLDKLEEEFAHEPETFERILSALAEESGPGAVGPTSHRASHQDTHGGAALGASRAEPAAEDVPRVGG